MWNLKCTIIPIVIGATGIVTRSLKKNLEAVPGKHWIDSLQKTAILGTSHIIRKVLQCEARGLSGGDHRWFKRSTRKKRPVTRDDVNNNNPTEPSITCKRMSQSVILNKRTYLFMDVEISGDRNVIKKETENFLNNKNLTIAIESMWTVKTKGISADATQYTLETWFVSGTII
jgi:hypothetical protein